MFKQWVRGQTAQQTDWLIGEGTLHEIDSKFGALRSMKTPGTAYHNTVFGSDPQVDHMTKYGIYDLLDDNDGVHINSGIPNKAFYLFATGLGGHSWDVAGKIWYEALTDPALKVFASDDGNEQWFFHYFAHLTFKKAQNAKYKVPGKNVAAFLKDSWLTIGITADEAPSW